MLYLYISEMNNFYINYGVSLQHVGMWIKPISLLNKAVADLGGGGAQGVATPPKAQSHAYKMHY